MGADIVTDFESIGRLDITAFYTKSHQALEALNQGDRSTTINLGDGN